MKKYVYMFSEGNEMMRDLLGGKGANLAQMVNLGLPVPQGFTVTTEACNEYYADGQIINETMKKQIDEALERLEKLAGKKLGGLDNPLLFFNAVNFASNNSLSISHTTSEYI